MRQRWNGSIQSSNTPVYNNEGMSRSDYGMYRCMVIDVLYVDDSKNISKNSVNPEVLYEVVILGGAATGQTLSFCRLASWLGGNNNYAERTLTKTSKDISKAKLTDHDGDIVYVQFNQGHDAYPTIIALGKGLGNKIGASKADGPRSISQYNGLKNEIDNKGQWHQTMFSGEASNGKFTPGKTALIKEDWLKDEKIVKTFGSGLTVTEDGKNDKVTIKTAGGPEVTIDGKGQKATFKVGSAETTIDGQGNKISIKAGSTEIVVDGGSGKISLKGEMVDLGTSVSDFVTKFTELASAFASHFHMVPQAPGGILPSMPPAAPLLVSVGSQTVKVQS